MKRKEIYIYIMILIAANIGLVKGYFCWPLIFSSQEVAAGQLWRVVTHPFLHSGLYHLLLDAAAFLLLYTQLMQQSIIKRTLYVASCGVGSLIAAMIAMPFLDSIGYCGLSGIDHGLMAICGIELLKDKTNRSLAIVTLSVIGVKCIFEAISGNFVFDILHNETIGSPVAAAHLGGAIGGCLTYWLVKTIGKLIAKRQKIQTPHKDALNEFCHY